MSDEQTETRTIILGVTESGRKFRPSDWAERMCGNLCTFRNRRIIYSPLLRPAIHEGVKSIQHPKLYKELLEFAKTNKLVVKEESITTT